MTTVVNSCQSGIASNVTRRPFLRFLNLTGTGTLTGATMNNNYSVTETNFYFQPPANSIYKVAEILISYADNANFNQGDFGAIAGGLTNGVKLFQEKNGVETQLIGGSAVKKNYEWLDTTEHVTLTSFAGLAQSMAITYASYADLGTYIDLIGNNSDKLIIRLHDDLSTLVDMKCCIRGIIQE